MESGAEHHPGSTEIDAQDGRLPPHIILGPEPSLQQIVEESGAEAALVVESPLLEQPERQHLRDLLQTAVLGAAQRDLERDGQRPEHAPAGHDRDARLLLSWVTDGRRQPSPGVANDGRGIELAVQYAERCL